MTHYTLLAQLESLYPGTAPNFHMSYIEAETTGSFSVDCTVEPSIKDTLNEGHNTLYEDTFRSQEFAFLLAILTSEERTTSL